MTPKSMGKSQTSSKREIQSYISLPQETRKISNKKYHLTLKLGEISEWKKETNKYQIGNNKKGIKISIQMIDETKSCFFKINKINKTLTRLIRKRKRWET